MMMVQGIWSKGHWESSGRWEEQDLTWKNQNIKIKTLFLDVNKLHNMNQGVKYKTLAPKPGRS